MAVLIIAAAAFGNSIDIQAQQQPIFHADRIPEHADLSQRTRLPGQLPAWVNPARDAGSAPLDAEVALTLILARSPEQQEAFDQLLTDQQTPGSASYHHWLTPQQIGDQFGPTPHDVAAITAWLRASGLQVKPIAPSRMFLDAYGPASAAAAALGTSFRLYNSLGKSHLSATGDPSIPSAFSAVVHSIAGLTDFELFPQSHMSAFDPVSITGQGVAQPQYTNGSGNHYLFPADFATIFDITPLYSAGINGAGQRVAIIGRSQINPTDITSFESVTVLPSNVPNIIVAATGTNPGTVTGDEGESDLDLERVLGVAPGVTADFVISGAANGFSGIYIAAQYEVQTLVDPVLSLSYGACEHNAGPSGVALWSNLFSQAAAEGISVFVSSGDSGAAFCDTQFATPPATQFLSVNYICSNPYTTCVGGTELADTASPASYWSSANGTGGRSALGYIPEGGWNDPFNTTTKTYVARASTGGASTLVGKPAYQTGVGVPADGFRDVPDVSFPASSHDGYFGCEADVTTFNGDCANGGGVVFSGTSAAAPGWAGVTALLNQRTGGGQGNLNPTLYRLASNPANGAFHDVTPATTGLGTCDVTVPSLCNNSVPSATALTGGQVGYPVQTGYDQVTGWGSADVSRFVAAAIVPTLTVSANPSSLTFPAGAVTGNTATLTYSAVGGVAGPVLATCAVVYSGGTAAAAPTCSVTGATLAASGSATGVLTIGSVAAGAGASPFIAGNDPAQRPVRPDTSAWVLGSLASLVLISSPRRKRHMPGLFRLALLALLGTGLSVLTGCGAGTFSNRSTATTTGAYTVTVTAVFGPASASVAVPLTVQ